MKKTIEHLVARVSENEPGRLTGGFAFIKGGSVSLYSTNTADCTNKHTCTGTNENICNNEFNCTGTTNKAKGCDNKTTCLI